jgi:tol-pal system protein YbgF
MKYNIFIVIGLVFLINGCALNQDVITLEERLMALERQNQQLLRQTTELNQQVHNKVESIGTTSEVTEKDLRTHYARLNAGLDTLQQEVRLLTGRIEEFEHKLDRKSAGFEDAGKRLDEIGLQMAKIEDRQGRIEQYLNFNKNGGDEKETVAADAPKKPGASDQQLYAEAKQAFDNSQMDKARQLFQNFIKTYPKSELANNAQFWIGESYYRDKWYEKAILEYQTVLEAYPKGNKVPAALLKQGLAFLQLGDTSNARLILNELVKKHPKSNEAQIAGKKLKEF